jgi:hypothetical protein
MPPRHQETPADTDAPLVEIPLGRSDGATSAQRDALLSVWERALSVQPLLRRPAVGTSTDGILQVSWSFSVIPGRVFTIEIHPTGGIEWFYRDAAAGTALGSDEDLLPALPAEALQLLADGFGAAAFPR